MQVVTWNIWGGTAGSGLFNTLSRMASTASVIALQEVYSAPRNVPHYIDIPDPGHRIGPINAWLRQEIDTVVGSDFVSYFAVQLRGGYNDRDPTSPYPEMEYGNLMLVRRELAHAYRSGFIIGAVGQRADKAAGTPAGKTAQAVDFMDYGITFCSGHGAWFYGDKGNLPWRMEQACRLEELACPNFAEVRSKGEYPDKKIIVAGDFNVRSDTDFVAHLKRSHIFGPKGGVHLNAGILDTRTRHYPLTKPLREANHAFSSPDLNASLKVHQNVASDHAMFVINC